jgi:outer membrane protein assembly factor BamB
MCGHVRRVSERLRRLAGALLIMLALIGPLVSVHPAPAGAQDGEPPEELTEIWSYEGSDFFETNPRVSNGMVLATTADSTVHAVDAETGEALWQTGTGYLNRPYMQVADGVLFTLTPDDTGLNAFDITPEGAEERWSVELPGPLDSLSTPVTDDGLILLLIDRGGSEEGDLLALNIEDGSEAWTVDVSEIIYGSGIVYTDGVVVTGIDEHLTGLDAATGEELWRVDIDPMTVLLVAGDGALYGAVRESDELFALDIASGDEIWNVTAPTEFNLPITYGDGLFFIDTPLTVEGERVRGILTLDAGTGEEVYTIPAMIGEVTTGTARDDRFYLASNDTVRMDGALEVYSTEDGTLLARTTLNTAGLAVDPESGVIYAASSGDGGDLLHAFEAVGGGAAGGDVENGSDSTAASSGEFPPDLAAMALSPWDLADAGLDNYGHGFSEMVFLEAFAAQFAGNRDLDEDEVADLLSDAGFVRAYYAYFYSPAGDGGSSQVVTSYVFEFEDEDGAAAAWDFLEDESDRDDAEDLDGFDDVADASEATLVTGEDETTGDEYAQIDATLRLGNLHAGVAVIDWTGEEPDEDLMADLLGYALDRVEDGLDADQPAVSNQALRLTGGTVEPFYDFYELRDGEVAWQYGESPDIADDKLDLADEAQQTELYSVWQSLGTWGDTPEDGAWYFLSFRRFEDDDAAADWVALQEENILANERLEDAEVEDADIGDGGIIYSALLASDGVTLYHGATFQSGAFGITIELSAPRVSSPDALEALVDEQLACLEAEVCIEPVEIPGAVEDFVADAEEGAGPDEDETPEADETPDAEETPEDEETEQADGGPVIYEGELYPFAVAYNANDWRIVVEDDPADDDEEWVQFLNEESTVWMVATPQFGADELGDCVDSFRVELGWEDAWVLEPLEELTVDDDRAFASYTMNDRLFGLYGYLSIECRPIDAATVLAIIHYAGADAEGEVPEAEVAAVETLKEGITIDGDADAGVAGSSRMGSAPDLNRVLPESRSALSGRF